MIQRTAPPKRRSKPRRGRVIDHKYRAFIRSLQCIVCHDYGVKQNTKTECAHVGDRGLGQKCSDHETAPLCVWHHQAGPESHHVLGKRFWEHHGIDRDQTTAALRKLYEMTGGEV